MASIRVNFNQRLRFRHGDLVEVASAQEGFSGSYFEATVVADLAKDGYLVQYRNLLKEDLSVPLREVASAAEVRPRPPPDLAERYRMNDVVDAFEKEGWWWGRITGRRGDSYSVFFDTTGDEIFYHKNLLRAHQEMDQWRMEFSDVDSDILINSSWIYPWSLL